MAFQKLQYQYIVNTSQPILLYYYGKYICLCDTEDIRSHFLPSGISALSEALRSCYPLRHDKIKYWLGRAYVLWDESVASMEYFKCIVCLAKSDKRKNDKFCFKHFKEIEAIRTLLNVIIKKFNKPYSKPVPVKNEGIVEIDKGFKVLESYDKDVRNYMMILYKYYVENKHKEAETDIIEFVERFPPLLYAYLDFWKIAKMCKNNKLGIKIADNISQLLERYEYPNDQWIRANMVIVKSLMINYKVPRHEEAKSILHELAQVMPPLPLPTNSEYEKLEFAENILFYLLNTGNDESETRVVRSASIMDEDDLIEVKTETTENVKEGEKAIELVEAVKLPAVKVENPQLNYVKRVSHKKKSSVFQEHMALQMEIEKEFKSPTTKSRKNSIHRVYLLVII
jgi:hypothetical protein